MKFHRQKNKIWENNNLTNMKEMRFKMAYNVVTITISFGSSSKWFLHFKNDPHVKHRLPARIRLRIQLDPFEWLVLAQDAPFFYMLSHLRALQNCVLIFQQISSLFSHLNTALHNLVIKLCSAVFKCENKLEICWKINTQFWSARKWERV